MKNLFFLLVFSFVFMACSLPYKVVYNSNPIGASLVCDGRFEGYMPITRYFYLTLLKRMIIKFYLARLFGRAELNLNL